MNINQANEIREQWGNKPCAHPALEPLEGSDELVCEICGTTGSKELFDNLRRMGK